MTKRIVITMIILSLAMVFLSSQCGYLASQEEGKIERPLPVIRMDSLSVVGSNYVCEMTVQTPDLCWEIARYDIKEKGDTIFIQIIGQREKDAMCAQMIGTLQTKVPLKLKKAGTYTIKCWNSPDSTIDYTITTESQNKDNY
ncbi:MAG: hypothetical protein D6748_08085 [Calditrichaeota bacterium]|nr:MAG: hypothetical protein D6748_08085 [Calditrichota bacterium]